MTRFYLTILCANFGYLFYYLAKLFKRHLLITLRVFFEDFDKKAAVDRVVVLGNLKVLAEHHKFSNSHDGGFVHYLLERWVLPSRIGEFAVVLEDYLQVVLVLSCQMVDVELVRTLCEFIYLLVLLLRLSHNLSRIALIMLLLFEIIRVVAWVIL